MAREEPDEFLRHLQDIVERLEHLRVQLATMNYPYAAQRDQRQHEGDERAAALVGAVEVAASTGFAVGTSN